MKKERPDPMPAPAGNDDLGELLPEYEIRGDERGKYAASYAAGTNLVPLDDGVV